MSENLLWFNVILQSMEPLQSVASPPMVVQVKVTVSPGHVQVLVLLMTKERPVESYKNKIIANVARQENINQ